MSHSNDDKGGKKPPQDTPPGEPAADKRSGRATFDSRGNSIWEWELQTGVYSRDVTTQKLKKLDLGELSIADSGIHPQPAGLGPGKPSPSKGDNSNQGAGFNPYDSGPRGGPGSGSNPYDNARAMSNRMKPDAPPPERRRTPADLRKLDQQIKEQRKKLKE